MKYVNTTLNAYILVLLLDLLKREKQEGLVNKNRGTQVLYFLNRNIGHQFDPGDPQNH